MRPTTFGANITDSLSIPTIGIGSGVATDGQVLVWHDMLGLQTHFNPKFVKKFAQGKNDFVAALNAYAADIQAVFFLVLNIYFEVHNARF